MPERQTHFAIVGGGMLGMTLALRLAERKMRVTLIEAQPHLGGLADAWTVGDVQWDRHYHVTLLSDSRIRQILKELQLDQEMQWVTTKTGFFVDGQLHSLSSNWDFLKFPPLNLFDKARLAWTILHASRITNPKALESIPVADWLQKHSGKRTFERIWLPLLKAKLGEAYRETSATFIWATIARMYAARRTGLKREMFGYLPGGYARLHEAFTKRLTDLGVDIRLGQPVTSIESPVDAAGSHHLSFADGETLTADRVVCTTTGNVTSRLCPALQTDEQKRLQAIKYLGIICTSVLVSEPLTPYYVTNITDDWVPFTGLIEMSALVNRQEFGGRSLLYLPKYVDPTDPLWQKSDAEIESNFLAALTRMFPKFATNKVHAVRTSRVKEVFALPTSDFFQNVAPTETSVPGLFVVNSSQIVHGTLNVNETVNLAENAIETLCKPASSHAPATEVASHV